MQASTSKRTGKIHEEGLPRRHLVQGGRARSGAPSPTTAINYGTAKCVDIRKHHQKWLMPWGDKQCEKIKDFKEAVERHFEANDIVFAAHIPMEKKEMSSWFQFMLLVLHFDIVFKHDNQIDEGVVTIDVSLAYRDNDHTDTEWTPMAHSKEQRKLNCVFKYPKTSENDGRPYDCDLLPLMEVGTVAHKYYLVNIRLPVNERKKINIGIGEIQDISLVSIHQNGGFTKVWFAMKTFLTPSILIIMIWYWRRITLMTRPPVLLEKVIFALGLSMTFINIPVEWFSIGFNWTWMLLFGDIRQGIFYAMLLSFWIIFCGEHLMGLIFRFKFLMLVTLACAALTVIFFIISQVSEGPWHWGEHTVQVNSAFFTGIYGMWNLYVFAIMFLYAPSHKRYGDEQSNGDLGVNSGEDIQLTTTITHVDGPTEIYRMSGKEAQE
ncbi:WLS protein, partial [Polypterus senegalus]